MIQFKSFLLLLLFTTLVSCYYLRPLRSGSLLLSDKQMRQNKQINRLIDLSLSKSFYEQHKDINVTMAITSLSVDDKLNFEFVYEIVCPQTQCQLNFTWLRHTEEVNTRFSYSLKIDYLVAHGLKMMTLNMTEFQEHLMMEHIMSYDQNNKHDNFKDAPVPSNQNAWLLLLFPNGFSNITLTGHIVYSFIHSNNMYVVHYMDHSNGHGAHDQQGWNNKKNYILYKAVFIPRSYLNNDCLAQDHFLLFDHFQSHCSGGNQIKYFFAFKRTKEADIQGEFFQLQAGYSFSVSKPPANYGVLAFPFKVTDQFVQGRVHEYKWQVQYRMLGIVAAIVIISAVVLGVAIVVYLVFARFLRRHKIKWLDFKDEVGTQTYSQK